VRQVRDLFAAGANVVQLDEPDLQDRPEQARRHGVKAINRALDGTAGAHNAPSPASAWSYRAPADAAI
jgi:methionine synthase II (cobalamin-independent)